MVTWKRISFDELLPAELYQIIRLRNAVFVVEQQCVFQDADNKDQHCYHLMGFYDERLVAYARIVPPGIAYPEASIGRVATELTVRGNGFGRMLMERAITETRSLFGDITIRIGAQVYLQSFYASLGFVPSGGMYPEDGIPHIEMLLS